MSLKNNILGVLLGAFMLSMLLPGCNSSSGSSGNATDSTDDGSKNSSSSSDGISRPEGWTEKTHGKDADPDYAVVFPDNSVGRIDITISNADWQSMMTDEALVSAFGEFGSRQGTGTVIPGGDGTRPALPDGTTPPEGTTPPADGTPPPTGSTVADGTVPPADGTFPGGQNGQNGGQNSDPNTGQNGGNTPDAGAMLEMAENPAWVPCTFKFNGLTWNYVGVRFKGNSSLSSTWSKGIYKLPFRFDFDQFEDEYPAIKNQRFYGFKSLSLSSGYNDSSLIREKVAGDIFRNLGVPAPKTAFYRLYVDCGDGSGPKYFGLYTMVEIPDKPMLNAYFGNSDGNLYKPSGTTASFGSGTLSEDDFDKENNKDEADYTDVNALYTAVNDTSSDSATWKGNLEKIFDVDGFLKWLAVNTVIQNWDTYGVMAHNYYLYNNNGKLGWIPWDNNESLKGSEAGSRSRALSLELNESSLANWPLIGRIIAQPEYLAVYRSYVDKTVTDYFNTATMPSVFQKAHDLVYNYVVGDEGEQAGYTLLDSQELFTGSVDELNSHVGNRVEAVKTFLEK